MRKTVIAMFLLGAFATSTLASSIGMELRPNCGGPFQLCGYGERGSEALKIPRRFEVARPFSDGLAIVRLDGRYGFIDSTGKFVIPPRFQSAGSFAGDFAEVRLEGASGIVDRSGRLVIPARFRRIIPFVGGTFIAEPLRENRREVSTREGALESFADPSSFIDLNGAGLFHIRRGWLTEQNLEFSRFGTPEDGLIWAGKKNEHGDDEWGLLKADGSWQTTPRYNHVQSLMETHAVVTSMPDYSLPPQERRDTIRWGAVDRNGKLAVPLKFAHLSYWRGGYGYAMEGRPYGPEGKRRDVGEGIVRADGSLLANRYFDKVKIGESGPLPRGLIDDTWYSIEPSGRLIPDQLDGQTLVECKTGLKILRRGEGVEFLRPGDGKPIGRFDNGYSKSDDCPTSFAVRRGERWFYVLENGTVLGGQSGFESAYEFSGNHAAVRLGGKWGVIDRSGNFTVEPKYAKLQPDRNGNFVVGEGENRYWIQASGDRVPEPAGNRPSPQQSLTCAGGLRLFERGGLWGLTDGAGKTVIEPRYRALSCFQQGIAMVAEPNADAWCPIGPDGKRRHALECSETYYPIIVTHHYPQKFSENPYENSVLWNRAWLDYQAGKRDNAPEWICETGRCGAYTVMPGRVADASAPEGTVTRIGNKQLLIGLGGAVLACIGIFVWKGQIFSPPSRQDAA
ncbi:WG repeat-containing protein [Sphingopyxis fribergensis]|jgi:hypothetical protein